MNQIIIKNLKIFAYHGVHEFEKNNGQNFYIDAVLDFAEKKNMINDDVNEIVSYSKVIAKIKKIVTHEKYNLIEKVAEEIALGLLFSFKTILNVEITVKKPEAPINEDFEYVAVKIKKSREKV